MSNTLRMRSYLAMGVSAIAIAAVAAPAFAQTAPAAPARGNVIEELVVTAQKREEAIQDVPIAVSAFSQDTLEKAKIDGGPNLQLAIPNVAFSKGNFTGFNFQIRGVGSKLVATSGDAGTGIHINNVPLTASNLFEAEFYDTERVEVLRGPQGTLYGRNATGGVVNVITAKPVDHFAASIKAEVGNFDTRKVRGMVNVPIGDKIALRVAGSYLNRGGFGKNLVTGNDIDGRDLFAVRTTVSFNPTEKFSSYLMWEHFKEDDDRSRIGKQFCKKDTGPTGVPYSSIAAVAAFQSGFLSQGCKQASVYDPDSLGTPNSSATLGGLLGNLAGLITGDAYAGKVQDRDLRTSESLKDPVYKATTDVYNLSMKYELTDSLTLTSLTGYSKGDLYSQTDYNRATPNNTFNVTALTPGGVFTDPQIGASDRFATFDVSSGQSKQWSQELRLQSSYAGPFNFNVGAISVDFKSQGDYYVFGNTLTAYARSLNGGAPCAANSACVYEDPGQNPDGSGHNYYNNRSPYHLKSKAAFGEVYYELSDNFKLTGGLRYTNDSKEQINLPVVLFVPGSGHTPDAVNPVLIADFKEYTGRIGFDWKPELSFTDSTLLYAFYSKGYKGGGINPPQSAGAGFSAVQATFAPEFVNSFEVGVKNTLLDGSLVFNATAFYYDYKGYQVSKIVNRTSVNENIDAKIKGLEIETIWEPINNLRFNANLGLLDTEIGESESIDTANRTQGDPTLLLVKASNAGNCVANKAGVIALMNLINATAANGGVIPGTGTHPTLNPPAPFPVTNMLGICSGAFTGAANPLAGFGINIPFSDGIAQNLKGNNLPNSPKSTLSIGAQYTWDLADGWSANLRGDYYRQGETYARIYNAEADRLDAWENVNATLQVRNDGMGLQIEGYVKNLLDDAPLTDLYLTDDSSGLFQNGFVLEPRTYGISIQKSF